MNFNPEIFIQNHVDFGGIITEEFLNRFSQAHFKYNNQIYHGKQHISNFGLNMDIKYDLSSAIVFDLSPIADDKFKLVWKKHLAVKGANERTLSNLTITPPNLKISVMGVTFTFVVYKEDGSIDFTADFNWDIAGTCAVILDNIEGEYILRLEPIKLEFKIHEKELLKEITKSFSRKLPQKKDSNIVSIRDFFASKLTSDPEKLVLYLLNQILATQMTNFVQQWKLPKAFEIIDGVEIEPGYLSIQDKSIAVGCKVGNCKSNDVKSTAEANITLFMNEFREVYNKEFKYVSMADLQKWDPKKSETLKWLKNKEIEFKKLNEARVKVKSKLIDYPENIMLFTNDAIADTVANKYFNFDKSEDYSTTLIPAVLKAKCGWSLKLSNADTEVLDFGLSLTMNAKLHGYAAVGCPNPDPKHWGEWMWFNLGASIVPVPNLGVEARPNFKTDGIYFSGNLTTQQLQVNIDGLPSWANKALGWITGLLSAPLFAIINLIASNFSFKIIDYPSIEFPGTGIPIEPQNWRFNEKLVKNGPYLLFSADTIF